VGAYLKCLAFHLQSEVILSSTVSTSSFGHCSANFSPAIKAFEIAPCGEADCYPSGMADSPARGWGSSSGCSDGVDLSHETSVQSLKALLFEQHRVQSWSLS